MYEIVFLGSEQIEKIKARPRVTLDPIAKVNNLWLEPFSSSINMLYYCLYRSEIILYHRKRTVLLPRR